MIPVKLSRVANHPILKTEFELTDKFRKCGAIVIGKLLILSMTMIYDFVRLSPFLALIT